MKDAAVFLLLGQSNAVGHILPMRQEDRILTPMKHVFGLSRTKNQSFDTERLHWSGYTSFDMNLGETQDHTYSVANCLAQTWENAINAGEALPELYIIHIAIGAQGLTEQFMWYPDRTRRLVPGPLGKADISLYPLTLHILSLLRDSFRDMGKTFEILGLHWRGGEEDTTVPMQTLETELEGLYRRMIREFREAAGVPMPVMLHRIICKDRALDMDPTGASLQGMHVVNRTFERLCKACDQTRMFDVRKAPQYVENIRGNGVFLDIDCVHYTEAVNRWVAEQILEEYRQIQP